MIKNIIPVKKQGALLSTKIIYPSADRPESNNTNTLIH